MMATPPTSTTQLRPSKLLSWLEVGRWQHGGAGRKARWLVGPLLRSPGRGRQQIGAAAALAASAGRRRPPSDALLPAGLRLFAHTRTLPSSSHACILPTTLCACALQASGAPAQKVSLATVKREGVDVDVTVAAEPLAPGDVALRIPEHLIVRAAAAGAGQPVACVAAGRGRTSRLRGVRIAVARFLGCAVGSSMPAFLLSGCVRSRWTACWRVGRTLPGLTCVASFFFLSVLSPFRSRWTACWRTTPWLSWSPPASCRVREPPARPLAGLGSSGGARRVL